MKSIQPKEIEGVKLDGYAEHNGDIYLVEIWAHQGMAKGAQKYKLMNDACKLILAEKSFKKECKKIICVSDENAVSFLNGDGWQCEFMKKCDVEIIVVKISQETKGLLLKAQKIADMYPEKLRKKSNSKASK